MNKEASCSCGQLKVAVSGNPVRVSVCHCFDCQRRSGSAFAAQARFHIADVKVMGKTKPYVRQHDDGDSATFHFCPECGSTVYYEVESVPGFQMVALGAFNDLELPVPAFSVWEERKHPWVQITGDMEHFN